jgi:hypothetical protein
MELMKYFGTKKTTEDWAISEMVGYIPAFGEPCLDITTGVIKYGDGKNTYSYLLPVPPRGTPLSKIREVSGTEMWINADMYPGYVPVDGLYQSVFLSSNEAYYIDEPGYYAFYLPITEL